MNVGLFGQRAPNQFNTGLSDYCNLCAELVTPYDFFGFHVRWLLETTSGGVTHGVMGASSYLSDDFLQITFPPVHVGRFPYGVAVLPD